ncbi:Aldolase-type TIM barrel [Corchorus capsularis]|uniref:Aldolase-type TIM barrel n=1 Tax=Corchorus capsularis TaxID=210143 RepID=A0A1R3JYQ5_COCAP|nr:Aldolase-type TIM barrel [Corchorus capsularis]
MPSPFVIGSGPPGTNYAVMKRAFDEGWGAVIAKTGGRGDFVRRQQEAIRERKAIKKGLQNDKDWTGDGFVEETESMVSN